MATCEHDSQSRGGWRHRKWISAAIFLGSMGIAIAAVLAAGTQLVSSPMATAGTTRATPWVPRPHFLPIPVPRPDTSVNAQGSPDSANVPNVGWVAKAAPPFSAIQDAMGDLGNALGGEDVDAMKSACRAMNTAGVKLGATLPAPTDDLTSETQAAVDEIAVLYSACLAEPPDVAAVQSHGNAANTHLQNVANLAQG